jgi:hypothetical protein
MPNSRSIPVVRINHHNRPLTALSEIEGPDLYVRPESQNGEKECRIQDPGDRITTSSVITRSIHFFLDSDS